MLLSTIKSNDYWAYQPLSISTIEPIDHWAYWPLSLSTIANINHGAYRPLSMYINLQVCSPLSLSTSGLLLRLLSLSACFCTLSYCIISNKFWNFNGSNDICTNIDVLRLFDVLDSNVVMWLIVLPSKWHCTVVGCFANST